MGCISSSIRLGPCCPRHVSPPSPAADATVKFLSTDDFKLDATARYTIQTRLYMPNSSRPRETGKENMNSGAFCPTAGRTTRALYRHET